MKSILAAVSIAATMLCSCTTEIAHSDPVVVPAFSAVVEPNPDGIAVRHDGIHNWADKTQSVVWYGDLRDRGALKTAVSLQLPLGQTAEWQLTQLPQFGPWRART